jgi:transcriptional regulator with XRE-family HTH domain
MELSERLVQLLNERKWTYYKLSKITGLPLTTAESLVKGKVKSTSQENLLKIAGAFGITVSELLGEKEVDVSGDYIEVAKYAQDKKISPDILKQLIDLYSQK